MTRLRLKAACWIGFLSILCLPKMGPSEVTPKVKRSLAEAMTEVRSGSAGSVDKDLLAGATAAEVLSEMRPYMEEGNSAVNRVAFGIVRRLSDPEVPPEVRRRAVCAILESVSKNEASVWSDAVGALKRFHPSDFDETSTAKVVAVLVKERTPGGARCRFCRRHMWLRHCQNSSESWSFCNGRKVRI